MFTDDQIAQLEELQAELPGLHRDALRLRWLCAQDTFGMSENHHNPKRGKFCLFTVASQHVYGDTPGEAIDAAMAVAAGG